MPRGSHPNPPAVSFADLEVIKFQSPFIYPCYRMHDIEGGRDVFALGNGIIKSSHLSNKPSLRDYSRSDISERAAVELVEYCLINLAIHVHSFHFMGKICQACDFLRCPRSQKLIKLELTMAPNGLNN
jgi:hypothetical protein